MIKISFILYFLGQKITINLTEVNFTTFELNTPDTKTDFSDGVIKKQGYSVSSSK
jgi:hypothetical protein